MKYITVAHNKVPELKYISILTWFDDGRSWKSSGQNLTARVYLSLVGRNSTGLIGNTTHILLLVNKDMDSCILQYKTDSSLVC